MKTAMSFTKQFATHFREMHYGPSFTGSNLKDKLADLTWQQATTQVYSTNSIATLVFHINYYVDAVLKVLQGGPLDAHDKFSFDLEPILSQEDWEKLLNKFWSDADAFAELVDQMPESKLKEFMADEKYGNYFRNLMGMLEHSYYHLGQIALIRKIVLQKEAE